MSVEETKNRLIALTYELNQKYSGHPFNFHQQEACKDHMSVGRGARSPHGRIYVSPKSVGYDISLYGISLERQMTPYVEMVFGRSCDGYKQSNLRQPFWRTHKWQHVLDVLHYYAKSTM